MYDICFKLGSHKEKTYLATVARHLVARQDVARHLVLISIYSVVKRRKQF